MSGKLWGAALLSALVAAGCSGSANAAAQRTKNQQAYAHMAGYPGDMFYIAPGDSVRAMREAFPVNPNPPSLRQQYNLRGLATQEFHH